MKKLVLLLAALAFCAVNASPQSRVPENDVQSWNDFQLTVPLIKKVDFVTLLTLRFGDNLFGAAVDERWGAGFNYKPNKYLTLGASFFDREARPPHGRREREIRGTLAATLQNTFGKFTVSDRNSFERRWREPQVDAWRYRNRLRVEHPLMFGKKKFTWFLSDEVFYDWSLNLWSRNRAAGGITRPVNKHLTLELYYMRQNDGHSRPGDLHILGSSWRFKL